ncbi:MAG: hypothetical protein JHC33_09415, partial [Ignisphaera sp.]|nr:hypothetical protein [Ignisphaera sp.]
MKRFLVNHYDATGFSTPTTSAEFDTVEATYAVTSKLIRTQYEDDISETISIYYTTPSSSLVVLIGDLSLPSYGTYSFQITTTGGTTELLINDIVVATSLLSGGLGSITLPNGITSIKCRFVGTTSTGSFAVTWQVPGQSSYSSIPADNKPMFENTLFPFTVYESVEENLQANYQVLGDIYQKQQFVSNTEPYKSFSVSLVQNTVAERVLVKNWFNSVVGKYKTFLFNARNNAFSLDANPASSNNYVLIKKAYTSIAYSLINKILYIPSANFASQVLSVEEYINNSGEYCEKLYLYD